MIISKSSSILLSIQVIAFLFLTGCEGKKSNTVKAEANTPNTAGEISAYCNRYASSYPYTATGRSQWRLSPELQDSMTLCKEQIKSSFNSFFEKRQSLVFDNALITLNEDDENITFPLWRIVEIGQVNHSDFSSSFKIKFDNGCDYYSAYKTSEMADTSHQDLKATYAQYFEQHRVSIDIKQEKDETIYIGGKTCIE